MVQRTILLIILALATGCYRVRSSAGGGDVKNPAPRMYDPADVAVPDGYVVELVAKDLSFPTGVAFDQGGVAHVVEAGYSYGEVFAVPRLLRLEADGTRKVIIEGKNGPWTGVAFHDGAFFIAEGGVEEGGRITRVTPDGARTVLVEKLPTMGDHHTNGPVVAADGTLYFSLGTATNSAYVGEDNAEFGWLKSHPDVHDVPCKDVTLRGINHSSKDAVKGTEEKVETGAYLPFGTPSTEGQVIKGSVPCSGAVMKMAASGGAPELVAWGFRNPFGLALAPDGALFVAENAFDVRGSRPVFGAGDLLWKVETGGWYGWPDYAEGIEVNDRRFRPEGHEVPNKVLMPGTEPGKVPQPVAIFAVHSSANGFDFSRSERFGHVGEAFVAEFGDMGPNTGKLVGPVGFKVVRVDVKSGVEQDFAVNRSRVNGPSSLRGLSGFERPVAARFDPSGEALYVVDFGVMTMDREGAKPLANTGALWRIRRADGGAR